MGGEGKKEIDRVTAMMTSKVSHVYDEREEKFELGKKRKKKRKRGRK